MVVVLGWRGGWKLIVLEGKVLMKSCSNLCVEISVFLEIFEGDWYSLIVLWCDNKIDMII